MVDVESVVIEGQLAKHYAQESKPTAAGTLLRCSDAGSCERKRWFAATGVERSESIDAATLLAFHVGTAVHEFVQDAFVENGGDFPWSVENEVVVDLTGFGVSLSGSADTVVTMKSGQKIVMEFKTATAYGAKMALDAPKREHVGQAGLYARGLGADAIQIVYVSKETSFRDGIRAGQIISHYFEMDDEVFPTESVNDVVDFELERFRRVEEAVVEERVPDAVVWDSKENELSVVVSPAPYGKPSKGGHWECRYCEYNSVCSDI